VVLDARGRTSPTARLLSEPGTTMIATTCAAGSAWKRSLVARGAEILECEPGASGVSLDPVLAALGARGILSVWVEGGATVLGSLFDEGNVDEVWAFVAPIVIGGGGLAAVDGGGVDLLSQAWKLRSPKVEVVGEDVLVRGYTGSWSPARLAQPE
jgi:diaminohydroxyphosphoribosylaminopyrimidine deaminase/5-amino-6-(5-phosphoribosylamino)uracil reductase